MKTLIERWKKGTRPLKIHEQKYGNTLVQMLEQYSGNEFGMFDDPVEAASFLLLIGMMKEKDRRNGNGDPPWAIDEVRG